MTSIIKVDNLQNQCGANIISESANVITIGASGDTVTLAAGASQSGFGRSGSVNWDTTPKTSSPVTAVSGNGYFINTTSGAITINLPSTPAAGDIVAIADYANTSATNNITVGRNGSLIDGTAADAVIFVNGQVYTLVYVDATEGWKTVNQTFNQIALPAYIVATGGTITTCGDFKIHSFTGPGTFTVCSVGNAAGSNSVQTLIVAGGGGGEFNNGGGGGGGGAIFTPTASIPVSATGYPISIGGGGSGGTGPACANTATAGVNTTGFSLTAVGGGFGGLGNPSSPQGQGSNGGSGGGDGAYNASSNPAGGTATQPSQPGNSGTFGNGFAGGAGGNTTVRASGGGGGASAVGIKGVGPAGGNGGNGIDVTPVFGSSPKAFYIANSPGKGVTAPGVFAGGGGGGAIGCISPGPGGTGGTGGGGNGGGTNPTTSPVGTGSAGTTNSGGGGGGGANFGPGGPGGNGGSGIVLIRYKFQ
jgi:hypothetical protein